MARHSDSLTHRTSKSKLNDRFKYDYRQDFGNKNWHKEKRQMEKSSRWTLIITPLLIGCVIFYFWYTERIKNSVRTPVNAEFVISTNISNSGNDQQKFWGTYRSGMYFGLKTRSPTSPVVGLLWMRQFSSQPSIRHWCDQGDGLSMYSWFSHDGMTHGLQQIVDDRFILTTDFVKRPGGFHGGDWTARISAQSKTGTENEVVSLMFYMALDGSGNINGVRDKNHLKAIKGFSSELGDFTLKFPSTSKGKHYNYFIGYTPDLAHIKEVLMEKFGKYTWDKKKKLMYFGLGGTLLPHDKNEIDANIIVHQITIELPFEMEILFESGSFVDRPNHLMGPIYQEHLKKHLSDFDEKFEYVFGLKSKGFKDDDIYFAKSALSNMLGGIGYFYGSSVVKSRHTGKEVLDYWKTPLYTAVPSRSFFPRGFLWDEGFHNLLITKWNLDISKEIIGHWLDLMNADGWIPREQILGAEARARVPAEFIVQHNENANPPTLFLPLQAMVKSLAIRSNPEDLQYMQKIFPRLKIWYEWFNTTQSGPIPGTYRWRGRDSKTKRELNPKTLTSGLDDGPRASHPSSDEYHVDLRCWMAFASGVMADIAVIIGEDPVKYQETHEYLMDNKLLDSLHWSVNNQYSDYGLHTDKVKLKTPPRPQNAQPGQQISREKERVTLQQPVLKHVNALGYISLFPFLLKIVDPQSSNLGLILAELMNPNTLWSKYGIRSLAKNNLLYNQRNTEHDPPYWRGAIWINMNYLVVQSLHYYSSIDGPYAEQANDIYQELRTNLINNIIKQFRNTGYIWEQYNDVTGKGQGSHPFTGWTALIVAIMAEDY